MIRAICPRCRGKGWVLLGSQRSPPPTADLRALTFEALAETCNACSGRGTLPLVESAATVHGVVYQ